MLAYMYPGLFLYTLYMHTLVYRKFNNDEFVCMHYYTVRLVNGPTKYEGRVEVYHNGEWGTVCDDGWGLNDAQVVCSELSLAEATAAPHNAFYGQGSGQTWLADMTCIGTEETIADCPHSGWGFHNCSHEEDASVNCTAGMTYIRIYVYVMVCIMYTNVDTSP